MKGSSGGSAKHKQLMEAGGVSKLHLAIFQGKQDKARKLLEKGCPDVNKGDKFGQTPLHIACHREGLLGCLELLVVHKANIRALDANGNTALHSAAGSGAAAAAEFLLGRGLSVTDRNRDGHTPLDICNLHCPADKQESMRALLEGRVNTQDDIAASEGVDPAVAGTGVGAGIDTGTGTGTAANTPACISSTAAAAAAGIPPPPAAATAQNATDGTDGTRDRKSGDEVSAGTAAGTTTTAEVAPAFELGTGTGVGSNVAAGAAAVASETNLKTRAAGEATSEVAAAASQDAAGAEGAVKVGGSSGGRSKSVSSSRPSEAEPMKAPSPPPAELAPLAAGSSAVCGGVSGPGPAASIPSASAAPAAPSPTAPGAPASAAVAPTPGGPKKSSYGTFLSALYRVRSSSSTTNTSRDSPMAKPEKVGDFAASGSTERSQVGDGGEGGGGSYTRSGGVEEWKQNTNRKPFTPRGGSANIAELSRDGRAAAGAAAEAAPKGAEAVAGVGSKVTDAENQPTSGTRTTKKSLQELHLAIFQGDTAKVEAVVERGDLAALNEADRHGQTPLHLACYKGSRVMTRLLVEGGANLEAVDVNGNGVVHAAVCDSPAVLAILIDHGADVSLPNFDGLTPKKLCEQYCPPRLKRRMLQLLNEAARAQAKAKARREELAEEQKNIEAVYHQLAMLRSKLAATAAANTAVSAMEALESTQTENALLMLVEANIRVVDGQRRALEDMDRTAVRLERMLRRLHMRLDTVSPGDVSFS